MAAPPPPSSLATKVSLTFSCKGLLDKDVTSKSDPIIQLMMLNPEKNWREVCIQVVNIIGKNIFD